jgi:hypothetical protein
MYVQCMSSAARIVVLDPEWDPAVNLALRPKRTHDLGSDPSPAAAPPSGAEALAAQLTQLRAELQRIAPVRAPGPSLPTGLPFLDRHVGGWPHPGLAALIGAPGTGRLAVILPVLQALTKQERTVAVVDAVGWLNPVGLPGVTLDHLLLVRAGPLRAGWAAEQLARSGAVPLTVLLDAAPQGRTGRRLSHAAEQGGSTVIIIDAQLDETIQVALRVEMCGPRMAQVARGGRGPSAPFPLPHGRPAAR